MQELGSPLDPDRRRTWCIETLDAFVRAVVKMDDEHQWHGAEQSFWDLSLLLQIRKVWGEDGSESVSLLHQRIALLREQVSCASQCCRRVSYSLFLAHGGGYTFGRPWQ